MLTILLADEDVTFCITQNRSHCVQGLFEKHNRNFFFPTLKMGNSPGSVQGEKSQVLLQGKPACPLARSHKCHLCFSSSTASLIWSRLLAVQHADQEFHTGLFEKFLNVCSFLACKHLLQALTFDFDT